MKKIIILVVSVLIISASYSVLSAWDNYDCDIARYSIDTIEASIQLEEFEIFVVPDDIEIALKNLKWYCCEIKKLSEEDWECSWVPEYYPESPHFMANLVDISFRKLDWIEESMYPWLEPYHMWQQWREWIRDIAESPDGYSSEDMLDYYESVRKVWETDWLYNKYFQACDESRLIAQKIFSVYNFWEHISKVYQDCRQLAESRISDELEYFNTIKNHKWKLYTMDNISNYTKDYFTEKRWQNLLEKFWVLLWHFSVVVEQVHNWVDNCSWE